MVKKNTLKEASEKYRDFKQRGLIPKNKKGIWQEFVKEVASDRKDGSFVGRYTAKGYTRNLGIEVEYGTGESVLELRNRVVQYLLEKYKGELLDIFDKNDFIKLAEKYGKEDGFEIDDIMMVNNFTDLVNLAQKAKNVQLFLFRNINGRNRRTESNMIEDYYDALRHELGVFIDEVNTVMIKYKVG